MPPQDVQLTTDTPSPSSAPPRASHVDIGGVQVPTERTGNYSKNYFSAVLPLLLRLLPSHELNNLQNIDYCNRELGLDKQYPLLSKNKAEMIEKASGKLRAWSKTIADFWVSAQWNKINLSKWKQYLQRLERELNPPVSL